MPYRWNGFGGKVDPGETSLQAAQRELKVIHLLIHIIQIGLIIVHRRKPVSMLHSLTVAPSSSRLKALHTRTTSSTTERTRILAHLLSKSRYYLTAASDEIQN
jgi:hypothetical protein